METQSRIFKVIVQFQEKDEVFYTRIKVVNGVPASLFQIICARYPSLQALIKRCYVIDKSGAEFSIINSDDLSVFLEAEELFENVLRVEINGVNRVVTPDAPASCPAEVETPPKRVRIEDQEATPAKDAPEIIKEIHEGVVCDVCDSDIVGFRYKCTECFNYDICMSCEGKMRHKEHIMIRIPSPGLKTSPARVSSFRRHSRKHPETTDSPGEHEKQHRHHHHGKRHQRRCQPHANLFDGFFRQLNEESPASDDVETAHAEPIPPSTATPAPGQSQQPPLYDFHKLVKVVETVAGNVSKLLDPLGMGMTLDSYANYGVNLPPTTVPTTPVSTEKPNPTAEKKSPAEKVQPTVELVVEEIPILIPQFVGGSNPTAEKIIAEKEMSPPAEVNVEEIPKKAPPSNSFSVIPEPTIMDVVDEVQIFVPTTHDAPMSPNASTNSDDAEWMVISREGMPDVTLEQDKATQVSPQKESVASTSAQTATAPSTETSVQTQGYDELARKLQKDIEDQLKISSSTAGTQTGVNTEPVVYHAVPHINLSIQRMMDMGFSNDGGCLTELMACCNGDIRTALDSLLYKNK